MAALLPTLCTTAHSITSTLTTCSPAGHRRRRQTTNRPVRVRPAEAATRDTAAAAAAAGTANKNKLSAWTSVREEHWEGDLAVDGDLPAWLNGTYMRNGPGIWEVGDHAFHHLLDGYATLVRVSFCHGRATGAHRQVQSDAYTSAMAAGRPVLREFSQRPANTTTLLERVSGVVGILTGAAISDNPNTTVLPLADGRVLCLTETTKSSVLVDPDTLATVGRFRYTDNLDGAGGMTMMLQAAHPITVTAGAGAGDELLTVLPDLVRPGYVVVRMPSGSNERKVVGRVECRGGPTPGWMHSFAVTDRYVVVPEMPLRYSAGRLLRVELAPYYAFDWLPESGSYMHVMRRDTGDTVATVEVPPFMVIHYINAYEDVGVDGASSSVVVDCCEHYGDPAIIHALLLHRLRGSDDDKDKDKQDLLPNARVGRFRIPLDGSPYGELETAVDPEEHGRGMDMCSINPAFIGKRYRYAYACGARRPCNFPNTITKIDLLHKTAKTSWHEEGAVPSEPFFVARPGAIQEDDGVVISIVSGAGGDGYALVLDATTFQEIARVRFPYGLPYGFHGCWIPDR